eukprot:scaffold2907_cov112-Isochrysis_galbana.AAC.2
MPHVRRAAAGELAPASACPGSVAQFLSVWPSVAVSSLVGSSVRPLLCWSWLGGEPGGPRPATSSHHISSCVFESWLSTSACDAGVSS